MAPRKIYEAIRLFLCVILENYVVSYKTSQKNGPGMCF